MHATPFWVSAPESAFVGWSISSMPGRQSCSCFGSIKCISPLLAVVLWLVTLRGRGVRRPSITFPENTNSVLPSHGWANSKGYQRLSNLPQRNEIFTMRVLYLLSSKSWPWIPNSCAILAFVFSEWRKSLLEYPTSSLKEKGIHFCFGFSCFWISP